MREFDELMQDIQDGIDGKNVGLPTGFPVVDGYTQGIQKSFYTLIGGNSGTGKTSFADLAYVLNPFKWLHDNKDKTDIKYHVIYNSMERPKKLKIAKWICLKLYQDYKIIMDVATMLKMPGAKYPITPELQKLIKDAEKWVEELFDNITMFSGAQNPTGIRKAIQNYAMQNGKVIQEDEFHKAYIPNNPKLITVILNDHIGKVKTELNGEKRLLDKAILDKHSENMGEFRDRFQFSPVDISQFNRSIGNIERYKNKMVSPEPDDFKGSGNTYENADTVIALFNPYKLKIYDLLDYKIKAFLAENGENRFRSLSVLKTSYGADDIIVGLNFLGENGFFRELPPAEEFKAHPEYYTKAANFT